MNTITHSKIYFKDFFYSLKPYILHVSLASIAFFFSIIISNPIFFKMIFTKLNVINFMKEQSLLINIVSIIGQITLIGAIFLYYKSFFKNRTITTNVKIFVTASIAINLFVSLTTLLPSVIIYILLNILGVENPIFGIVILLLLLLYSLYVVPYFYGKSFIESNGIRDVLKIFISALNPKRYFSFLKNKNYLKIVFNISFLLSFIILFGFIFIAIIYALMVTTSNEMLFRIMFLLNNFFISLIYVLISYMMIYISIRIYETLKQEEAKKEDGKENIQKINNNSLNIKNI